MNSADDRSSMRILIIADDALLAAALKSHFVENGWTVHIALRIEDGRLAARQFKPHLLLLDLKLPDGDGKILIREVALMHPSPSVLVMGGRTDEVDRVVCFRTGADDFIEKPFGLTEMDERVRMRLRDYVVRTQEVTLSGIVIDFRQQIIIKDGKRVGLTRQETRLLLALLTNPNRPVPRDQLLSRAWGYRSPVRTRSLDWFVSQVRKKVEHDASKPRHLITVRGVGYQLNI